MLAVRGFALIIAVGTFLFLPGPLGAQTVTEPPQKVKSALELLGDPEVSAWLKSNVLNAAPLDPAPPEPAKTTFQSASDWLHEKRTNAWRVVATIPALPEELSRVGDRLSESIGVQNGWQWLVRFALVIVSGLVAEFIALWVLAASSSGSSVAPSEMLACAVKRLSRDAGRIVAFAVGGASAFLTLDWAAQTGEIGLLGFVAVVIVRVALAMARFLIGTRADRSRIIPISSATACIWYNSLTILTGWVALASVTMITLNRAGIADDARQLVRALFLLVAFAIATVTVWRQRTINLTGASPLAAIKPRWTWLDRVSNPLVTTALFVLLWGLMISQMYGLFWCFLLLFVLPWTLRLIYASFANLRLQPTTDGSTRNVSLWGVAFERFLVACVVVGAAALNIKASEVGLRNFAEGGSLVGLVVKGVTQAVVIALLADLAWHLLSAWMNRALERKIAAQSPDASRQEAKIRTLLPILRNVLFIFIVVVAGLMALSGFGIEIGPLLAGAGIFGVAVGFGAQTVVKDIISGMFYLLDDAFRVGEYIQSGSYKGTVESFSLRSVRLRHHRGPLSTVPFSELGAIENMSRDWVIEKILVGVTYDTDLSKVKKVVKEVGKQLTADPELAPFILETLKLQGVEEFADFSVDIRMKIKTIPGDGQFMVKRRALALIKTEFEKAGIEMPFPTVQVAGQGSSDSSAAAASRTVTHQAP